MKIKNWKLKILLVVIISCFLMFAPSAQAGFIIKAPAYLGLNQGLVGCWTFDGSYTKAPDCSGNNNTGTLTSSPTKVRGKVGQAIDFGPDLGDDDVNVGTPSVLNNLTNMSISAWIYPRTEGESSRSVIVAKGTGTPTSGWLWRFAAGGTNALVLEGRCNGNNVTRAQVDNSITLNRWQHVVLTTDGSCTAANWRMYVNGVESSYTTTNNGTAPRTDDSTNSFRIGNQDNGANQFDGIIDEIRVYNRILSAGEIQRLYLIGLGSKQNRSIANDGGDPLFQGLVGYWTFDGADIGNSGVTAKDRSGNSNNGTLTNGPVPILGKIGQALNFNGSNNDYVDAGDPASGLFDFGTGTNFSTSFWIKASAGGHVISKIDRLVTSGFRVYITTGDSLHIVVNTTTTTCKLKLATGYPFTSFQNTWRHVTINFYRNASCVAGDVDFYVDGQKITTLTDTATANMNVNISNSETLKIGTSKQSGAFSDPMDGIIDDVRIYNRALSATEIKRLYNQTQSKFNSSQTDSLTYGLVGCWTFDGSYTKAPDCSGNNNTGTLTNGPTKAQGKVGQAIDFVGTNAAAQYVNLGASTLYKPTGTQATISVWIKSTTSSGAKIIAFQRAAGSSALALFLDVNASMFYRNAVNTLISLASSIKANDGNWHHFVGVINGTSATLYVDGVQSGSATDVDTTNTFNFSSNIATLASLNGAAPFIAGKIDEVRFYHRALSASEIQRLYDLGRY